MFEDLKKSQRGGSAGQDAGGPLRLLHVRDPKMRLWILVGALVVILAAMFGLDWYAGSPEAKRIGEQVPTEAVGPLAGIEVSGTPPLDMSYAEGIRDATEDDLRYWPHEAVAYLLLETRNTPSVNLFRRNLLPITPESAAGAAKDSKPWRFKFVRFRGELEYVREEDHEQVYGEADPPLGFIYRGRILVRDGDRQVRVLFIAPTAPVWRNTDTSEPRPPYEPITDGWVRGRGIFVKNHVDTASREEPQVLLVVATRIERDYRTVPVETLDDIPFDTIDDHPSLATDKDGRLVLAKEYPRALYRFVRYAEKRAGEEGAALRAEEELKPGSFDSEQAYASLIGDPKTHRTKYYGGLGALAMVPALLGPASIPANDAGLESCLAGWILTDKQKMFQFVAPAALAGEWRKRHRIRYEGYFYKSKLYHAKNGTERLAPLLVLTVLEEVKPAKPNYTVQFIIAGAFILGIALLFFLVLKEDRTKESYRRLRRKRAEAT